MKQFPRAMTGIGLAAAISIASPAFAAPAPAHKFTLSSSDIANGGVIGENQVANIFGCTGGNASPALAWKNPPAATKSFALTVYDPDAPTGSGFWHWVVFDIPAQTTSLPKNAGTPAANLLPAGAIQSRTDFGTPGYGGPCPPKGDKPHHYHFTLFALDVEKIDAADVDTTAAIIGFNLHFHTLGTARLTATYGR